VHKIKIALWNDFTGRGPRTGVWWHGSMDELTEVLQGVADLPPPAKPDDIPAYLQLFQINIRNDVHQYDGLVAELCFHAPFEEEHNVGILTDGQEIIGIGHHLDVSPFGSL
jgi:hypothetical protein